ncbi:hypothetical protein [Companilactobacillus kimchiensis]|uniref:Uncharacterized protein n=1 Tax=Companilactobacillus kimchiensis TaxID=993692 RepID=A0A0R2LJS0_9LACO|nr:hypothetical protein [Companilactobacillus kimchiensis]KRN99223.1 hypothetical protein IV57_GL000445 [Companilactobacillus kimchiensis]
MKKKLFISIILSVISAGLFLAVYSVIKLMKKSAVKKDREKLESYVEKYLHGNDKLMEFVGTLSDAQVKELIDVLGSLQKEQNELKLKAPIFPKYLEKKVTNLIS